MCEDFFAKKASDLPEKSLEKSQKSLMELVEKISEKEKTFILIKPDAIERGLVGQIISYLEKKGFKIVACQMLRPNQQLLENHYFQLKKKDFFAELIEFMLSGPVIAMVWQGKGIIAYARKILGETDPLLSAPGTIRGDLAIEVGKNLCHASDGLASAKREINLWFTKNLTNSKKNDQERQ